MNFDATRQMTDIFGRQTNKQNTFTPTSIQKHRYFPLRADRRKSDLYSESRNGN